ncbi:DUF1275 domain-containing protein [Polystyrenella longa]|nr:DUF1275 domain-containing protein [Polystyrenella longa]
MPLGLGFISGSTDGVLLAQESNSANSEPRPTVSPLHKLLRINPETGQFEKESGKPQNSVTRAERPTGSGGKSSNLPAGNDPTATDPTSQDAVEELVNRINNLNSGEGTSIEELAGMISREYSGKELVAGYQTAGWLMMGFFLIYPLAIILAEVVAFYWQLRNEESGQLERRYLRKRLWRRFMLALVIAAFIVACALSIIMVHWWTDPIRVVALMLTTTVLAALWAMLTATTKQLDRNHTLNLIRDVRHNQLELRKQVMELHESIQLLSKQETVESSS